MRRVERAHLHDAQGDTCLEVLLPRQLDARGGANVEIQPNRCIHLIAAPDTDWTVDGIRRIVWRTALRVPLTFDDVPEPLAAALEAELLAYIDWLTTSAA